MALNFKTGSCIALLWVASLALAFWAGGGSAERLAPTKEVNQSGSNHTGKLRGGAAMSSEQSALAGGNGARSLSPSSIDAKRFSGNAPQRMLHLLSGATGADLDRDEFEDIAENMSLEEVLSVVNQLANMDPSPSQRDAYTEVLERWAQLDATAALEHVATIDSAKLRYDATIGVLRHWAAVDPAAAVEFVDSSPSGDLPKGSLSAVFRGIGRSMDTTSALEFIGALDNKDHQKYAYDAVRELFERNDTEVIEWTASLPEGEVRDRSVHALIDQWARYDPIAAKAWLAENTSETNRAGALVELGESWARIDPESAATWAMEMPGGDTKATREVLDRVFRRWMEYDIGAAAGYLVEQEPSPELDGAVEHYIQRIKNVDPEATMAWAESISDPKRRRNAVLYVAKTLRSHDPQAYQSYIESSPVLTDAERNKLLGIKPEKPKARDRPSEKIKKDKIKKLK